MSPCKPGALGRRDRRITASLALGSVRDLVSREWGEE